MPQSRKVYNTRINVTDFERTVPARLCSTAKKKDRFEVQGSDSYEKVGRSSVEGIKERLRRINLEL